MVPNLTGYHLELIPLGTNGYHWNSKILYRHLCLPIFQNTLQNQFSDTNTAPEIFKIYFLRIKAEVLLWYPRMPLGYFGRGCWLWWCCCFFVKYATWDERNQKNYIERFSNGLCSLHGIEFSLLLIRSSVKR